MEISSAGCPKQLFTISGIAVSATKNKLVLLGSRVAILVNLRALPSFAWKEINRPAFCCMEVSKSDHTLGIDFTHRNWSYLPAGSLSLVGFFHLQFTILTRGDALLWNQQFVSEDKLAFVKASFLVLWALSFGACCQQQRVNMNSNRTWNIWRRCQPISISNMRVLISTAIVLQPGHM